MHLPNLLRTQFQAMLQDPMPIRIKDLWHLLQHLTNHNTNDNHLLHLQIILLTNQNIERFCDFLLDCSVKINF